jgi:hypothetical protein
MDISKLSESSTLDEKIEKPPIVDIQPPPKRASTDEQLSSGGSKIRRTDSSPDKDIVRSTMRIRDQQRHQRLVHLKQQRSTVHVVADRKRQRVTSGSNVTTTKRRTGLSDLSSSAAISAPEGGPEVVTEGASLIAVGASGGGDVYEFRSSSDSEEQRPTMPTTMVTALVPDIVIEKPTEPIAQPQPVFISKKERLLEMVSVHNDKDDDANVVDESDESRLSRKVPPLRISLTKTPSEDDSPTAPESPNLTATIVTRARSEDPTTTTDEPAAAPLPGIMVQRSVRSSRLGCITGHHHNTSSDGSSSATGGGTKATTAATNKAQRMTRSKVRMQGIQLDDDGSNVQHRMVLHPHKRKNWKRTNDAAMPLSIDAQSTSVIPNSATAGTSIDTTTGMLTSTVVPIWSPNSSTNAAAVAAMMSTDPNVALLYKNSYEGFRMMRKMVGYSTWFDQKESKKLHAILLTP